MNFKDSLHTFPFCSTEITFCTLNEMKSRVLSLHAEKALLVMSESSVQRWGYEQFLKDVQKRYSLVWIKNFSSNPTQRDIHEALKCMIVNGNSSVPDCIIAIGGGSAIDLAKGIAAFCQYIKASSVPSVEEISESIKKQTYRTDKNHLFPPIIAVPSTAGTGSELTQWATIWDANKNGKFSIDAPDLKPRVALIVPELTMTLSSSLTLSTGLDALAHAIEAYWSKYTTPLVQDLAYRAIQLVINVLPVLMHKQQRYDKRLAGEHNAEQDKELLILRTEMCRASILAGLAFSRTRTTACHSLSYPMTLLHHVPHGMAAAMTLGAVGEKNKGLFPNSKELFALFAPYGNLQSWLDRTCEGVIPLRLSSFGITKEDIPALAYRSFTSGRMENNPAPLGEDDVKEILQQVF